jgi:hypothetical protein
MPMIQITPHMKILMAVEPADFRKGIDSLSALCRKVLKSPFQNMCLYLGTDGLQHSKF